MSEVDLAAVVQLDLAAVIAFGLAEEFATDSAAEAQTDPVVEIEPEAATKSAIDSEPANRIVAKASAHLMEILEHDLAQRCVAQPTDQLQKKQLAR